MYLEAIKFVCEMVTKLWVFKHSPLVLKIAPTTTLNGAVTSRFRTRYEVAFLAV